MPDYKIILGIIGIVIGFLGTIPYFRGIFLGTTKPHFFSWFIWTILTGTAFVAQILDGGGPGSWVTGVESIVCFSIAVLAFFRGEKNITRFDWMCLGVALFGIVWWIATKDPLIAVVLVVGIDAVAFLPTFRKTYIRPHEETVAEYSASAIKYGLSLFALEHFSIITALYPATLVLTNGLFVLMAVVRRKKLKK